MEYEEYTKLAEETGELRESLVEKDRKIEDLKMTTLFQGTLFNGISEEILVLDPDFNIKDANKAFLRRYGVKKWEILSRKCYQIEQRSNAPCSSGGKPCPLARAKETGERVEMTHHYKDGNNERKELFLLMYPIKLRGKKIKYFMEIA